MYYKAILNLHKMYIYLVIKLQKINYKLIYPTSDRLFCPPLRVLALLCPPLPRCLPPLNLLLLSEDSLWTHAAKK